MTNFERSLFPHSEAPGKPSLFEEIQNQPENSFNETEFDAHAAQALRLENWIFKSFKTLEDSLLHLLLSEPETSCTAEPFFRSTGFSGFFYRLNALNSHDTIESQQAPSIYAQIQFTPSVHGGFALRKIFHFNGEKRIENHVYSDEGRLVEVLDTFSIDPLYVGLVDMEPNQPIIAHLYDYLAYEYAEARLKAVRFKRVIWVENFLQNLLATGKTMLSIKMGHADSALQKIFQQELTNELDPVLTWEERQKLFSSLKEQRWSLRSTKRRVHKISVFPYYFLSALDEYKVMIKRLSLRPLDNFQGISYKYTIGLLLWFIHTVRSNIGYSIALALYGPFTFYFITQPLNPHAMWAVGKVRTGYSEVVGKAESLLGLAAGTLTPANDKLLSSSSATLASAATGATLASSATNGVDENPLKRFDRYSPQHLGLLVSTDVPSVDKQSWTDRMSRFKDMQIGYEEHMQASARLGRIEQIETQLNFPLIADSTWQEIERTLEMMERLKKTIASKPHAQEWTRYFDREIERSRRLQLYVWDRLLRYVLDHPYIVMDAAHEQPYHDYYLGRAFILIRQYTQKLSQVFPDFKKPNDYKRIEKLASNYEKMRSDDESNSESNSLSILDRLKRHSPLFKQKDRFDGRELRTYMQRNWEVLYLLQNKAQEASNFGLMMYTWSTRNTLWILQGIYSAKQRELSLLFESSQHGPQRSKEQIHAEIRNSIEPLYETLFHLLNLEFVSIRPELSERLGNDIEFVQRHKIIQSLEEFLKEREEVWKW